MLKTIGVLAVVLTAGAGIFLSLEAQGVDVCCVGDKPAAEAKAGDAAIPLVCTLTDPEKRARRGEVAKMLSAYALSAEELETGFSITFENGHGKEIVEFVELERECCAFFEFALTFKAGENPTVLTITGPENTKDFLRDTIESWSKTRGGSESD